MQRSKALGAAFLFVAPLAALADTVSYTYDSAGRLIGADYGDKGAIVYTYDKAGNLTSRQVVAAGVAASAQNGAVASAPRERRRQRRIVTPRRRGGLPR